MSTTIVEREKRQPTRREFVGRVWQNKVREGEHKGKEFFSVRIDRAVNKLVLTPESRIQLWPNVKREGKQDADYRMSIILPDEEEQEQE